MRLNDLRISGVALWVLGNINKPQQLIDQPQVWYPGSPQALSAKETGAHGPLLITVLPNQTPQVELIKISPVRYEDIEIDISGVRNEEELRSRVVKGDRKSVV